MFSIRLEFPVAAILILQGCSLAPAYKVPSVIIPANFKEAAPWTDAQPADAISRGAWWTIYNDAELSELETRLDRNSPDLAAVLARYAEARAYDDQSRSGLLPTLSGILDPTRNRQSDTRPLRSASQPDEYGSYTVGVQANYEIDLWGRVRNEISAAHSTSQAVAADLESAKLSLETRLADDYLSLLGRDREIKLLADTVDAYEKALTLTQTLHDGGVVSGLDVSRANAQLDAARAQVSESLAQRALLEHAIAALVGESASVFSLEADAHAVALPQIPSGMPAELLQRRPDIAAAERRTAAANAGIGVARAAFYPSIDLSASIGLQSSSAGSWLMAPATYWALGPMIVQTIFDAGLHSAQLAQARAAMDEAGARYRSTVLTAFQQVEDDLALLKNYGMENTDQTAAVEATQRTLEISMGQYRDGGLNYLEVVDSQTAALIAQRAEIDLQTRRLRASVGLIRDIGGGWTAALALDNAPPKLPSTETAAVTAAH